jgi:hypothetical protein
MPATVTVWTQDAMVRIFGDDPVPASARKKIELFAARGETECFQIGIHARGIDLNYLSASAEPLQGPGGKSLDRSCVQVLFAEYVPVKWGMEKQGKGDVDRRAPGFFPDPLVPDWELDTAETISPPTRSAWVQVQVPPDARAGIYRGRVRLTAGRKVFAMGSKPEKIEFEVERAVEFTLRVWGFTLPASTLLHTNWFFPEHLADWYKQPMWSPAYWRLIERVADDMAAHRQNVILTPLFGGRTAEEQLVGVYQRGRSYRFDWRGFDRWAKIFLSRGFRWLEGAHIAFGSRRAPSVWVRGASANAKKRSFNSADDKAYEALLRQFFAALADHLRQRGWQSNYVQHISDEPKVAEEKPYARLAGLIRKAAPGLPIFDALTDPELADLADYPVPLENEYDRVVAKSKVPAERIWTYYCCGPSSQWPNRFIEFAPIRWRIFSWLCFDKNIPGFLHWGYNYWRAVRKSVINPWDDPTCHRYGAGDPCIVYPPRDATMLERHGDKIIGSIRWEIIREAMEDYEYLRLTRQAAEAGDREARAILKQVHAKIVPGWTTYTRDWNAMKDIRQRMGRLLSGRKA